MKRQGIGNELLKKVESIANKFGIKEIFLEVRESNKEAISFYKTNEFLEIGLRKTTTNYMMEERMPHFFKEVEK